MDIHVPPVPNKPRLSNFHNVRFHQDKANPVKRSFQVASWFTNSTWLHYDEAKLMISRFVTKLCVIAYMKCLHNRSNFTSKNCFKMHQNRFHRHLKLKKLSRGRSPEPPPPARVGFNGRTTFHKPTTALYWIAHFGGRMSQ